MLPRCGACSSTFTFTMTHFITYNLPSLHLLHWAFYCDNAVGKKYLEDQTKT